VIESGVEVHFIVLIITFYFNLSELAVSVCFFFLQKKKKCPVVPL